MNKIETIYDKLAPEHREALLKTAERMLDIQERKLFAVIELKYTGGKPAHGGGLAMLFDPCGMFKVMD